MGYVADDLGPLAHLDRNKTSGHIQSMPRPSTKEQIVEAAVEALHTRGFNATSVQDITDLAQVPKGSFYNHFDSKESIGVEALDRYWQRVRDGLQGLSDGKVAPLVRLKRYFRHLAALAESKDYRPGCFVGNMSAEMPGQSQAVRERLVTILSEWTRAIESCVREAQDDGSVRRDLKAKSIAMFILNSWEGAVIRSKVDRNSIPLAVFQDVVFTALSAAHHD